MKTKSAFIAIFWGLITILILTGCNGSHRKDSDFIFREDKQEPQVNLGYYRSVQDRTGQNPEVALAIAVSGGGYRAANFAAGALCEMEQLNYMGAKHDFLREVDYFSTVSGGGFTAGLLLSEEHRHLLEKGELDGFSFCERLCAEDGIRTNLMDSMAFEYLKTLGKTGLSLKAYKLITSNRTKFFEQTFEDVFLGASGRHHDKSMLTGDIFVPSGSSARPRLPYWFQNATVFENGAIFPHSPDIYKTYGVAGYTHRLKKVTIDSDEDYYKVPLAIGMVSSAAYPPVMSPVSMRTGGKDMNNNFIYLIDGGISDFLGVITALRILEQEKARTRVLVIIDAGFLDNEPFSKGPWGPHFLNVGRRVMDISTDSWRTRYKDFAMKYAIGAGMENIRIVSLDFFSLGSECKDDVKDIIARFNISVDHQDALFRAGSEIVRLKARELYCSIEPSGAPCEESAGQDSVNIMQAPTIKDMCAGYMVQ